MEINNNNLDAFRNDFNIAMKALQDKYDVTISLGKITYGDERFSAKVTVVNGNDSEIAARNEFDADVWRYSHLGLRPGMYNRIFRGADGNLYAIQGFNTRAKKRPFKSKSVSDGKLWSCSEGFIKEILNEYYTEVTVRENSGYSQLHISETNASSER